MRELGDAGAPAIVFAHGFGCSQDMWRLVARDAPHLVDSLVLVCPSPRYLDAEGYRGGFAPTDMEELLTLIDRNYLAWAGSMAPTIMAIRQFVSSRSARVS